jgi:hypothetical protein
MGRKKSSVRSGQYVEMLRGYVRRADSFKDHAGRGSYERAIDGLCQLQFRRDCPA